MFEVFMEVKYERMANLLAPHLKQSSRILAGFRADANHQTAVYWHKNLLKKRFAQGNHVYRLQKRKQRYSRIKRELGLTGSAIVNGRTIYEDVRKGGTVDMVRRSHPNNLENRARAAAPVTANKVKAIVKMSVPGYAARRPRDGKPDFRRELTATTQADVNEMRQQWHRTFYGYLKKYAGSSRRKL